MRGIILLSKRCNCWDGCCLEISHCVHAHVEALSTPIRKILGSPLAWNTQKGETFTVVAHLWITRLSTQNFSEAQFTPLMKSPRLTYSRYVLDVYPSDGVTEARESRVNFPDFRLLPFNKLVHHLHVHNILWWWHMTCFFFLPKGAWPGRTCLVRLTQTAASPVTLLLLQAYEC